MLPYVVLLHSWPMTSISTKLLNLVMTQKLSLYQNSHDQHHVGFPNWTLKNDHKTQHTQNFSQCYSKVVELDPEIERKKIVLFKNMGKTSLWMHSSCYRIPQAIWGAQTLPRHTYNKLTTYFFSPSPYTYTYAIGNKKFVSVTKQDDWKILGND